MRSLPAALAGFLAMLVLLFAAVLHFTLTPSNYPAEPPYAALADEVIAYLSGRSESLSDLFTERERLHMADVLRLYQGAFTLAAFSFVCVPLLLVLGAQRRAGGLLRAYLLGAGLFFFLLILIAAWAAADFSGWFTAMHLLAFTNDLWLLNPAESMLIRMVPQSFFVEAVLKIAGTFALLAAWATAGPSLLVWASGRRRAARTTTEGGAA